MKPSSTEGFIIARMQPLFSGEKFNEHEYHYDDFAATNPDPIPFIHPSSKRPISLLKLGDNSGLTVAKQRVN